MKIAIIGTGISGLSAAYALSRRYDVEVFEANERIGGHANTTMVSLQGDEMLPVDTGFIVYNTHNYPNLVNLFEDAGVETEESDMSFSVSIGGGDYEYAGDPRGIFAQKRNILRPGHWQLIRDIFQFYKNAPALLALARDNEMTLGELLDHGKYSDEFRYRHILPMAGAIWSTPTACASDFPAETFINFFENHRLFEMDLTARPIWRTVSGGSKEYVNKVSSSFADRIRLGEPVSRVVRTENGIRLSADGSNPVEREFDEVIFACHPDTALAILGDSASSEQATILSAIPYADNTAILHTDLALMPKRRRAWASWNYLSTDSHPERSSPVALTYWMNRLQNLGTDTDYLVTLNPLKKPAQDKIIGEYHYRHPQFSVDALRAQRKLKNIQGIDGFWFCGAWCGYGFHEDGASAGFAVANALGAPMPWTDRISEMSPAGHNATPVGGIGIRALAAE